jgi:membrane protein
LVDKQLLAPPGRGTSLLEVLVGAAVALWSSVEAMSALEVALDVAYETPLNECRGFLGRRLAALPLLGVTVVLGGAASSALVLGGPLGSLLPSALSGVRPEYHDLVVAVRYAGAFVVLVLLLSIYFRFGTRAPAGWDWVSPGAVVAAGGWMGVAAGFSFYLDHFGHEARDYGSLAGSAVTLLWLFLTAVAILLGAELNPALERMAEPGASPSPGEGAGVGPPRSAR